MTWLSRLTGALPPPLAGTAHAAAGGILATPPLIPGREGDFEALWFFCILGLALVTLVSIAAGYAFRSIRPLWREGERLVAVLMTGAVGFVCIFILAVVLTALIGLTNHPRTPGTAPATIGAVLTAGMPRP